MSAVPFVDLVAQHRALRSEITAAITRVIDKCDFILGTDVEQFEQEFARYIGVRHGVGVASGLDALRLSLQAAGLGPGDEVILPANTFIATALAVTAVGATPVLTDIDETTFNLTAKAVEAAVSSRTRAVIPVHLYGQPCDMEGILAMAKKHGLTVIEDACQAHGARYQNRRVGSFGLTGCFSFYPGKNLGACGDGGMIVTDSEELAERLRFLRNCGQRRKYEHVAKGSNSRLDTLQAAILRVKLPYLDFWNQQRADHAGHYSELLAKLPGVTTPVIAPDRSHVFHLYVVRVEKRAELQNHLTQHGIQTGIHYPVPIHLHIAYANLSHGRGTFPIAESLANEILSLPMFPGLTSVQMECVTGAIRSFCGANQ